MFRKDVLVKSNVKLKSSDKKKFASLVLSKYPEIKSEIELQGDVFHLRVTVHDGRRVEIYLVGDEPWIFIDDNQWYPSVYFLWKYPEALYTYVTHAMVLMKLQEGADLMLPGIIVEGELNVWKLGKLCKWTPCAVALQGNRAAVAVGKTNISSQDMIECGMRGKGVQVLHVVGDFLWKMGTKEPTPIIPLVTKESSSEQQQLSSPSQTTSCDSTTISSDVVALGGDQQTLPAPSLTQTENGSTNVGDENVSPSDNQPPEEEDPVASSDELFRDYFLRSIKEKMLAKDFPILASTFLGSVLLPYMDAECGGERVNVKDTSYKKFSTFLTSMKDEGVISVEERQKGIQWISTVNLGHVLFSAIRKKYHVTSAASSSASKKSGGSEFKEMFSVTAAVLPLIRQMRPDAKKGDPISASDFRSVVSDYVKSRQLQNGSRVKVDSTLTLCLNAAGSAASKTCSQPTPELSEMPWDALYKSLFAKMQPCYEFHFTDGQSGVKKGKAPTVVISVAKRAGNKRVTLINNLAPMGIEPAPFARELQIALAASATLNEVPASVGAQVQVQGDDTSTVMKILTEKYNVPTKAIKIV